MDIWQILMTPFSWLLKQFCLIFNSYGIALILFSIIVKLVMAPFQFKGKKSMIKMNILSGQQKEIQTKYANNPNKMNEEIQKLYAENGVSPMGGCLWSLIPMFMLFPLYAIVRRPMKYMMWLTEAAVGSVADKLNWAAVQGSEFVPGAGTNELILSSMFNEGNIDAVRTAAGSDSPFLINFNFLGLDLSNIPTWEFWKWENVDWNHIGLFLMVILSAVAAVASMIIMTKTNAMNQQQAESAKGQNRVMLIMQPVLSLWIGFSMPAGMCIYWISNSVLTVVQEMIFGKMLKKDYEEAQRAMAEQAAKAKAEEKERRRAAAEKKAAALAEKKSGKKKPGAKKAETEAEPAIDKSASRVGMRQYARGRAYDPNRYPVTPYHDPSKPRKEEPEEAAELTEEEKAILAEDAQGTALLEQAEAAAAQEAAEAETEDAAEAEAGSEPEAESEKEESRGFDKPVYDKPNFDDETKE